MRRVFFLLLMMLAVSPMWAGQSPFTVIVMDTTQALLANATVKVGSTTLTTSFDGKAVVEPQMIKWYTRSITVQCAGYKKQRIRLKDCTALTEVRLVSSGQKKQKEPIEAGGRFGKSLSGRHIKTEPRDGVLYMVEEFAAGDRPMPSSAIPNNITAGKLTAGEVNDFAKWPLWSQYAQASLDYQKTWGLMPNKRYTVQVTDKHGYPIVNYPVNLTDSKGNTIFQAMTDNTGKAELWAGLTVSGERLELSGDWHEGLNTLIVDESCEHSDAADVVFVFDATGSMGDELRYLQAEMKDVIARAKEATGGLAIRTGAVVYRDHGDIYLTRLSRLTDDIATTQAFIDQQYASGGGDFPEAVPEALMAAINSAGWDDNARARIAFLILDAPCHEDSATLALLHDQILNAAAQGIRIVPVVCSGLDKSGEYLMRAIALATNCTSFFLTDDSGIGLTHLQPTTDSLKVEHLNDMLVRTIVEFSAMPDCKGHWTEELTQMEGEFIPDPFDAEDLTPEERILKDSRTTLYLLDITGKLITVYQGRIEEAGDSQLARLDLPMLSTGVYFVKAFYDGEWHTQKILVH